MIKTGKNSIKNCLAHIAKQNVMTCKCDNLHYVGFTLWKLEFLFLFEQANKYFMKLILLNDPSAYFSFKVYKLSQIYIKFINFSDYMNILFMNNNKLY